jgi:Methionyl-tRNA formyltransferase
LGYPGEVKEISEDGITISAKGGGLLIKRVKPENEKKINSYEYASKLELLCGEIFGK